MGVSIAAAQAGNGTITVQGRVQVPAGSGGPVTLELFGSPEPDPASARPGALFLGRAVDVPVDGQGRFQVTFRHGLVTGFRFLTLTATVGADTSEFSNVVAL